MTVALLAWRQTCETLKPKHRLIPHDVVTWWNLTYDMMRFTLNYWEAIDSITTNKTLKLCKYKLFADDWNVIQDLHQENDMTFFCHFLSTFSHLLHLWKIDIAYWHFWHFYKEWIKVKILKVSKKGAKSCNKSDLFLKALKRWQQVAKSV